MGAVRTIDEFKDFQDMFYEQAISLSDNLNLDKLFLYYHIFQGAWKGKRAISAARRVWEDCSELCGGTCVTKTYEKTLSIRNNYLHISNRLEKIGVSSFMVKTLNSSLSEWDELVEDCSIVGDQEIRDDFSKIASMM